MTGAPQPPVVESTGWRWGPFTFRLPFLHTRPHWPEVAQGLLVATATGLALVPILMGYFGMSFEEGIATSLLVSTLIVISLWVFGDPYAPGWITPALPLVLAFVLARYETPELRFQAMTALSLSFALLVFVLGITRAGPRLMAWLPPTLRATILIGSALAAFRQVFVTDAPRFLEQQPVSILLACAICLVVVFSAPLQRMQGRMPWLRHLVALGLLPGFLAAAIVGPLVGEVVYDVQWGWLLPPVGDALAKMSPFSIGWPPLSMYVDALPLVLLTYVITFGDWVTGEAVIRDAQPARPDDPIRIDARRSHLVLAVRNAASGLFAPLFPTQGALWAGVHVVVVSRWRQGPKAMRDLHSGLISYYMMGLPVIYFLLPLLTGLQPLLGVALAITLVTTGFACAYIGMGIARTNAERGSAVLGGVALSLFDPWIALAAAVACWWLLVGREPRTAASAPGAAEDHG
ncbi:MULTISPECIES: hypothetical protein [unclassified Luteimonas]|uniref:hypothetical protein n=1 Tax=unclassified Luteimonas TaxID=2629088 RepID=UPI0018F0B796|nr:MULTISPECIES: hypothetical protein [unclassified Luteimonas]MBJ6978382.1 hypothetical protein [Luteimonas sp. MC1895]MBJ6983836.1 hypothetical protein [Luteimonas sp. MC1750]QQO06659.1 hypothetical protein JGR68_04305 [Luteimonas sp. MC1750]